MNRLPPSFRHGSWFHLLRVLLEKEVTQLRRNSFLIKVCMIMPVAYLTLFPFVVDMDIKHINIAIVDADHSPISRRAIEKIRASTYFNLVVSSPDYTAAQAAIEKEEADVVLQIPQHFERHLTRGDGNAALFLAANAVNGSKGALGLSYLSALLGDLRREVAAERAILQPPSLTITPQYRFNRNLDYRSFMIPAMMGIVVTMLSCFLPALSVVMEKEKGTLEQMNVTPVTRTAFILAKLLPLWGLFLMAFTLALLISRIGWGIVPQGSLVLLYGVVFLGILAMSTLGIIVSNLCDTLQQAIFVMLFFAMFFILLGGLFTPIYSMPQWAQAITCFNPVRYFIEALRSIVLKGSTFADILPNVLALLGFFLLFLLLSVKTYKKTS